jgi:hypothetical protein
LKKIELPVIRSARLGIGGSNGSAGTPCPPPGPQTAPARHLLHKDKGRWGCRGKKAASAPTARGQAGTSMRSEREAQIIQKPVLEQAALFGKNVIEHAYECFPSRGTGRCLCHRRPGNFFPSSRQQEQRLGGQQVRIAFLSGNDGSRRK